ncbi:MAG: hypothetical protein AB7J13_02665 [Pyrinomonadaceae bacterium]
MANDRVFAMTFADVYPNYVSNGEKKGRTVDGIVQNKYANDPGKLAAWLSAKHVEKAPKKKAPPTP